MPLTVHMIGNAHLDPVWLWPWQEGLDEALSTFHAAADRCEEYPEFIFTQGDAWQYEQLAKYDPRLFERIKGLIARNQWAIAGGQYIQPDLNAPTGESHRRQFVRGMSYFQRAFGVRPTIALNVDSFGHPASFPDLVVPLGVTGYAIQRPKTFQMVLPQAFVWRGAAGAELVTFKMSKPYTSMTIDELKVAVEAAIADVGEGLSHTMCFYGVGNHGGGPSKAQIEWILDNARAYDDAELRFSTPDAYFTAIERERASLPTITGDLQHCFPGCYAVMHDIHQTQRLGELKLNQTQNLVRAFTAEEAVIDERETRLDAAWDDLLFTAFHDILAGTSVKRSWRSVRAMQGRALITGEEVATETTRRWVRETLGPANAQRHVFLNGEDNAFSGLMEIEPWLEDYSNWDDRWISDSEGRPVPFQLVQPETNIRSRLVCPVTVPARGHTVYVVHPGPPPNTDPIDTDLFLDGAVAIENAHIRVELGAGGIAQVTHNSAPVLAAPGLTLHLREDPTDCWGMFNDAHEGAVREVWSANDWVIEETGPLRARARLEGRLGASRLLMLVSVERGAPHVDIELEINFDERHTLFQMPLNWAEGEGVRTDGIPGGRIERAPSVVEWPFQGWTHYAASSMRAGLLTHDAYSLSHRQDQTILTLLRAPVMANAGNTPLVYTGRDDFTDQGVHAFRFRLICGDTPSLDDLHARADALVKHPEHFDYYEGMTRPLPLAANHSPPNSMVVGDTPSSINSVNRQ